jgi:CBS domain containing-hemolysin-like protein
MQWERQQLAIVINEYGGTEGIVTVEDLLEELVGDIPTTSPASSRPRHEERSHTAAAARSRARRSSRSALQPPCQPCR